MGPEFAEGMKYLGAGLAMLGMIGAGIGVGNIVGNFLDGAMRNPSAAPQQIGTLFVGIAFAEALGLFAFVVAMIILFV